LIPVWSTSLRRRGSGKETASTKPLDALGAKAGGPSPGGYDPASRFRGSCATSWDFG